jgi:hypothetical protein
MQLTTFSFGFGMARSFYDGLIEIYVVLSYGSIEASDGSRYRVRNGCVHTQSRYSYHRSRSLYMWQGLADSDYCPVDAYGCVVTDH